MNKRTVAHWNCESVHIVSPLQHSTGFRLYFRCWMARPVLQTKQSFRFKYHYLCNWIVATCATDRKRQLKMLINASLGRIQIQSSVCFWGGKVHTCTRWWIKKAKGCCLGTGYSCRSTGSLKGSESSHWKMRSSSSLQRPLHAWGSYEGGRVRSWRCLGRRPCTKQSQDQVNGGNCPSWCKTASWSNF